MREHEADIIKVFAALTAAPRWVAALVVADGGKFVWGEYEWWAIGSAILSVLFAAVETYAAAYIMRAWRRAKPGTQTERVLFGLWVSTLFVLVCVMAPPIYANTTGTPFNSLPLPVMLVWSVFVASSTFLVVGGVGYAERPVNAIATQSERPATQAVAIATPVALTCETCGRSFANRFALSAHQRSHAPKKAVENE
jgi:hypothetical protein